MVKPFVSVCTPTFNRRPFIPTLLDIFRQQNWPRDAMEWIIVDDGTDPVEDLIKAATDLAPVIRYFHPTTKMSLGAKRNFMHAQARGEFLVYMDDDDYYPSERIRHSVESLQANPSILIAGSSVIYIYYPHLKRVIEFGPYGPNHATAGTFAFRRELLALTRYDDKACFAEEPSFLRGYSIPMVQLDPRKTILVVAHRHNSVDKKRLLPPYQNSPFIHDTPLQPADFIKNPEMYSFFIDRLDPLLAQYPQGESKSKPDLERQLAIKMPPLQPTPEQIIRNQENIILQLRNTVSEDRLLIQKQAEYIAYLRGLLPKEIMIKEGPKRNKSTPERI